MVVIVEILEGLIDSPSSTVPVADDDGSSTFVVTSSPNDVDSVSL